MRARVYKPKHPKFTRNWTHTCPVCAQQVRVNKDGTVAAHFATGALYCLGSREPV